MTSIFSRIFLDNKNKSNGSDRSKFDIFNCVSHIFNVINIKYNNGTLDKVFIDNINYIEDYDFIHNFILYLFNKKYITSYSDLFKIETCKKLELLENYVLTNVK